MGLINKNEFAFVDPILIAHLTAEVCGRLRLCGFRCAGVCKLAGADEFVQKLPKGYDTVLEENAANLSGGQKQRLAIARALLTNPPILIFDEATSALDPESEEVIRRNLKAIAKGRTVLIVSHRLSIISHADVIMVVDSGEAHAVGKHHDLIKQPGIYQEFWNQQMCVEGENE